MPFTWCCCTLLAGYAFVQQGISSCAVNTSAVVGTTFAINFTVFDYSIPSLNASVARTVSIINPCDGAQYLCSDGTCSSIACNLRSDLSHALIALTALLDVVWGGL